MESLQGDRAGQHSIRINDQYRICFRWVEGGAENVQIVDYLCRFFGLSDGYWLRAQAAYDIEVARRKLESELKKITPFVKIAAAL